MAAMTALPLSFGMRDLEDRAEKADDRQYAAEADRATDTDTATATASSAAATASGAPSASGNGAAAPLSSPASLQHSRREYTAAFFHPRVLFVFVLGCLVPMIYIYLYVGAFWNPQARVHNAKVLVFNFDAGIDRSGLIAAYQLNATGQAALSRLLPVDNVGALLGSTLLYTNTTAGLFDWRYCDVSNCSYSSAEDVQSAADKGDISEWYSLVVPANYTQQLLSQAFNLYSLTQLNDDISQLVATKAIPSPLNGTYTNVASSPAHHSHRSHVPVSTAA